MATRATWFDIEAKLHQAVNRTSLDGLARCPSIPGPSREKCLWDPPWFQDVLLGMPLHYSCPFIGGLSPVTPYRQI